MCGVEYFAHPWEFGPRKTKELMLTGDSVTAQTAYELGMVSKVFPQETFREQTVEFARRITKVPTMAALLIKESVNQAQDNMGFYNSLQSTFTLHQLNHAHWAEVTNGQTIVATGEHGAQDWRTAPPPSPASRDMP
jgi:enoyl-CoA hydratase